MNFVADRINRIKPSMTVGINIKAKAMKEEKNTHDGDNKRNSDEINKLKEQLMQQMMQKKI